MQASAHSMVGIRGKNAAGTGSPEAAFWDTQFADLDAEQFPILPSTTYTPRPIKSAEYTIEGLGWESSAFKPTVFIRLAWAIVQAKYTNSTDVLFGAATGVNGTAFPTRVRLDYGETVDATLRALQTQSENMAAMASASNSRDLNSRETAVNAACDYQTMLVLTNSSRASISAEIIPQQRERRRQSLIDLYALTVECTISVSGLWTRFVHDPIVLTSQQIQRISAQLGTVLRQILMQPQSKVGEIGIASEQDLQDIWEWNQTALPLRSATDKETIVDMFAKTLASQRAGGGPAIAVDAWDGQFTYAALDELSTKLAHHVRSLGVGKDSIVPIYLEKSKWMSVAMLGVLKSGAATLCLNGNYPEAYSNKIVAGRSQIGALICSETTQASAKKLGDGRAMVVMTDEFFDGLANRSAETLLGVSAWNTLCVIPASENALLNLTHANFAVAIAQQSKLFSIASKSRVYDLDSYDSPLTYLNHLLAFTNGACLCVPSDPQRKQSLADSLSDNQASVLITTAASAQHIDFSQAVDLETLVVTGEFTPKLELPPHVKLIRAYGVSACTVLATCAIEDKDLDREGCVGRGFAANTWIVSTSNPGTLCGVGEVGELWLEGPLVASGYLQASEKTKEHFVDEPEFLASGCGLDISGRKGRLVKTGDLARYMPDGSIIFVRHQRPHVNKVRGKRVDMTEVEGEIRSLLGDKIFDVVVEVISAQGQPEPVLAAFIVPPVDDAAESSTINQDVSKIAEGLSSRLKQRLPSHMVPIVFLPLRKVPLTSSGQIDRKRLRQTAERKSLDRENRSATHAIRPAQAMTVLEVQLQQLWAQVLNIKDRATISANSNWISLGGDEDSAMRLTAAAQNWGLAVTVADVLARPRLADMAETVKHFQRASVVAPEGVDQPYWSDMRRGTFQSSFASEKSGFGGSSGFARGDSSATKNSMDRRRSSILVNGKEEAPPAPMALMPLTAMQKRLLQGSIGGAHPPSGTEYYAFDLPARLEPSKVIDGCRKLVEHFDMLRTVFVQVEDAVYQTIVPNVEVPIEVHQMYPSESLDQVSGRFMQKDAALPIMLGRSLLRIYILHEPSKYMRIMLRTNQAHTDAESMTILGSALSDVLSGKELKRVTGIVESLQLPSNEAIRSQSYWRNFMLGASMSFIPKSVFANTAPKQIETIAKSETLQLPNIPSFTASTIFTAACALLVGRLAAATSRSNNKEVLFARQIATRSSVPSAETQTAPSVGPYSNLVPVRVRLDPKSSILKQISEQFVAGMEYHNVAFEDVGNDRCLTTVGEEGQIGVDFGLVSEFHSVEERSGDKGVKWLGKRENEVMGSNAVVVEGCATKDGKVKVEIRAKSNLQTKQKLEEFMGSMREVIGELGREGRGKRGVDDDF